MTEMIQDGSKPGILFVDDDPLILQGLQRMLRPLRNEWSMSFVESGAAALEIMGRSSFQVVVSDMRMPGMNGAQLLSEIKNRHPRTVRLILSGHADKELIMQCVGTAHQFLAKPCEPEAIRSAIARAFAFDTSQKSEKIKSLIAQMDKLPSIPSIYTEVVETLRREDCAIEDIGELIAKDMAITAKLLKLVNSSFFGLRRQISSPSEAVVYLGIDTIKALVLSVGAFSAFENAGACGLSLETLWSHSLEVGAAAKRVMEQEQAPRILADESFIAGILHDVGKLALCVNAPAEYDAAMALSRAERMPLYLAEEQTLGANHAEIGGSILSLWGLPVRVVEAITFHHDPAASAVTTLNPLIAVHLTNAAVHAKSGDGHTPPDQELSAEILEALGLNPEISHWIGLC